MYFRSRFLKSKLLFSEVNELRIEETSTKNHTFIQKTYGNVLTSDSSLDIDLLQTKLNSMAGNEFKYFFSSKNSIDGPILLMYAEKKIVFSIRLDSTYKTPKCICVSAPTEKNRRGRPLNPEDKSQYKYFQSINNFAFHALNTYVSHDKIPILSLIEWCRVLAKFPERVCKITKKRMYWSKEYSFLPTDFASIELNETDLIHKSSIVFK